MGIDVLKLTIAGLVLATIVVVYLIFSQRFFLNTATREADQSVQKVDSLQVPTPTTTTPTPTPTSQQPGQQTTKGGQLLPATGFPFISIVLFALSVTVSGWFLRKYPH